ncbi:MAG: beta-propeller domain-containing protein [Candidatus Methanosuratincola petrocarbonis]
MRQLSPYKKAIIVAVPLVLIIFVVAAYAMSQPPDPNLKRFTSMDEIEAYLKGAAPSWWPVFYFSRDANSLQATTAEGGLKDYSTTNIQVAGVDEADIVKSDGEYLYVASGDTVYIVKAYPPGEARVVSKIALNNSYSQEIYINGDRLVIIGNGYSVVTFKAYPVSVANSFVRVYDITDRSSPELARELVVNGTISGSRMIGEYVYIVSQEYPYVYDFDSQDYRIELPAYACDGSTKETKPEEIYYIESQESHYLFMTVISLNVIDDSIPPSDETFLAGASSTMYVSPENMYLVAHRSYPVRIMIIAPSSSAEDWKEETLIYRLSLKDGKIALEASGSVPGGILNQYSMDEHNGHFRVATTEWTSNGSKNAIYVMNMKMEIVGSLEGIAPGERIYSARFMGDRCYLVTFRQVDPFFVIDLSDPSSPSVLGYLKIPGYSSYLHPLDEDHIIGLGKEGNNLKLSLFNVEDVSAPREVAKFGLNYTYSDSESLYDPKAFLFSAERQLLAIPVGWTEDYGAWKYSQGAFVFNVSAEGGFSLRGIIVHQSEMEQSYWSLTVRRILYIEDALYTVSNDQVRISDFVTLDLIKAIPLQ